MKRFRICQNDTVKATVSSYKTHNYKLLATVYDSGFTTINQVINTLNRKIVFYEGNKLLYNITIPDREISKQIIKKVN